MAGKLVGRGQFTLVQLHNGKNMQLSLNCNLPASQLFSRRTLKFTPDYAVTPIVITPELHFSGAHDDKIATATNPVWEINGKKPIEFGGTFESKSPYRLTINKNLVASPQLDITFQCNVVDPDTNLPISIKANTCFTKKEIDNFTPTMVLETPDGVVFKNEIQEQLTAVCKLYQGTFNVTDRITRVWSELVSNNYEPIENNPLVHGQGTDTLVVHRGYVSDTRSFKCDITFEGATYSEYVVFTRQSDPYTIKVVSNNGDKMKNGQGTIECEVHVYRSGQMIPDDIAENMFKFQWRKYNKNTGQVVPGWRNPTTRKIVLTKDDITRLATFMCELTTSNTEFPFELPFNVN